MAAPKIGSKVKDFELPTNGDGTWSLKNAKGRKLVIYFYPKDMTSGCTRESQDFRDLHSAFRKAGVDIVGVSRDSVKSHDKFVAKEDLPFPLLSDAEEKVCKLFDVIQEKSLYGKVPGHRAQHVSVGWHWHPAARVAQGESYGPRGGST